MMQELRGLLKFSSHAPEKSLMANAKNLKSDEALLL
jgi:hypothetical protein